MIFIDNINDLLRDIEYYKQMFPNTYKSIDEVKKILEDVKDEPIGTDFGFSVSSEWPDKCYEFEISEVTELIKEGTVFRYLGVYKC